VVRRRARLILRCSQKRRENKTYRYKKGQKEKSGIPVEEEESFRRITDERKGKRGKTELELEWIDGSRSCVPRRLGRTRCIERVGQSGA
jgi:hypothetical protein